jgi:hypothetical protein
VIASFRTLVRYPTRVFAFSFSNYSNGRMTVSAWEVPRFYYKCTFKTFTLHFQSRSNCARWRGRAPKSGMSSELVPLRGTLNPKREYSGWDGGILATQAHPPEPLRAGRDVRQLPRRGQHPKP